MVKENSVYVIDGSEDSAWYEFVRYCWATLRENNMSAVDQQELNEYFYCVYDAELEKYNATYSSAHDFIVSFPSYQEFIRFKLTWS